MQTQTLTPANASAQEEGTQYAPGPANSTSDQQPTDAQMQVVAIALDDLSGITGRKYTDIEDAKKHLVNLNSFVGDQTIKTAREKMEQMDSLVERISVEQGMTRAEAERFIAELATGKPESINKPHMSIENPANQSNQVSDPQVQELKIRLDRSEFLNEHQDARPYIENLEDYVKATGVPFKEAYQKLYGAVLADKNANAQDEQTRQEKMAAQVMTAPISPVEQQPDESKKLIQKAREATDPREADRLLIEGLQKRFTKQR